MQTPAGEFSLETGTSIYYGAVCPSAFTFIISYRFDSAGSAILGAATCPFMFYNQPRTYMMCNITQPVWDGS